MNHLILFAKYPEPGRVKTRLASSLGKQAASQIYEKMLKKIVQQTFPQSGNYQFILCFDPPERKMDFQKTYPQFSHYWTQRGQDLGKRLENAFIRSFNEGAQKSLVIGSDCLSLDEAAILQAFELLNTKDVVLGPAQDGGYYLLGVKKCHPLFFQDIPWSTSFVLKKTTEKIRKANLQMELLKERSDIDSWEDYVREFTP